MYYGKKSVKEVDDYYGIGLNGTPNYPWKKHKDCEKIQQAFNNHAIQLTLAECKELYSTWSDEAYCASWECGIETWKEEDIFDLLMPWLKNIVNDRIDRITVITEQLEQGNYI